MWDLKQLRAFAAIVEAGNLTHAAERLGMQQPPLTRLLHRLEAEMGEALMQRLPRGMQATAAGMALYEQSRELLQRADALAPTVRRHARGEAGRLAVGFTSSAALHPLVPKVLRDFRRRYPDVDVVLEEAGTGELLQSLAQERLQAAFVRAPAVHVSHLQARTLLQEPMLLALPAGDPAPRGSLPLARLAGVPLVLYRRPAGPGLYDTILTACHAAGFIPNVIQEAPRLTATLSLVAAGMGASIVPASMQRLRTDGIRYRGLTDCPGLLAPLSWVRASDTQQRYAPLLASLESMVDAAVAENNAA